MWSIFHRKKEIDTFIHERWESSFGRLKNCRFLEEETDAYRAKYIEGGLELHLMRSRLFAWVADPLYLYKDFVLEGDVAFTGSGGYSALGFKFRVADEKNYYYMLVSSRGYFRFDLVFNGNPRSLVQWAEVPGGVPAEFSLRIIAHGTSFSFYIDNEWVGEIEDDTLASGQIAFAGQNYDEEETASFLLKRIVLESRPVEVEAVYYRWTSYIPVEAASRIHFARNLYLQEQYSAAVIQLKKAFRIHEPSVEELFLFGESLKNTRLFQPALGVMEKIIEKDPKHDGAVIEKAGILYLLNEFIPLRDYLEETLSGFPENPVLWNLSGNGEYALGNWEEASKAYSKAFELDNEMPIFALNAARAFDRTGEKEKALEMYISAGTLFFRQEAFEDLSIIRTRVHEIDPDNRAVIALEGKAFFAEEHWDKAAKAFDRILGEGSDDSSVYFLRGLIFIREGDREKAGKLLYRAAEMEDTYPLYWLKLAENSHSLGLDGTGYLDRAYALSPDDPWILNLKGAIALEQGNFKEARDWLSDAHEKVPEEIEITLNFSQILYETGNIEEAFALLEPLGGNSRALNQLGNLLVREDRIEEAADVYERAYTLDSDDPSILENLASVSLRLDRITRAEELLRMLIDLYPSASAFDMIGSVAFLKGELRRAETAFSAALKLDPNRWDIRLSYADILFARRLYDQARKEVQAVLDNAPSERAEKLFNRIRMESENRYFCALCGREWWVPKNIRTQPPLQVHGEPPGEAPAGRSPVTGKIYCISCASEYLKDNRFICPESGENLKLSDNDLKYLLAEYVQNAIQRAIRRTAGNDT
ncbi:MAG: tetratricopeptide repeat protein [Spirochaetales bacterium]|nr:tetratricopeptide repeat protein [Spirochaetales bacterium]